MTKEQIMTLQKAKTLLTAINEVKVARGFKTDKSFCAFLEIDNTVWSRINKFQRKPDSILGKLLVHLPEVTEAIEEYMKGD